MTASSTLARAGLLPAAAALLAGAALAGQPGQNQVCFSDAVALQPTNWNDSVTIPKFDTGLGTLTGVQFTLSGEARGAARVESLDAQPSVATLTFQSTISLTRPDMSLIVVALPQAVFNDPLTAFDGTVDFGGTSGVAHENLVANDVAVGSSPPPMSDLALFSGPPGNPGTIVLPVSAVGNSSAAGPGNLISQFVSQASCSVTVCYLFSPNVPPDFTAPQCGATLMASAGVPMTFQVCASDVDPQDVVTLSAVSMPAGAVTVPALPQNGNPVCVDVQWTPDGLQAGLHTFTFQATDLHQRTRTCSVDVLVAECHLLLGYGPGAGQFTIFGHTYDTQLQTLRRSWPVTMDDHPSFPIPPIGAQFDAQLLMYNPQMFPQNPSQWSRVVRVVVNPDGSLSSSSLGTRNGITMRAAVVDVGGQPRLRFPFRIDGM